MEKENQVVAKKHTLGIVSLILSLIGIFVWFLSFIFAPIALIFGILSYKRERSPWGIAGLVISSVTIIVLIFGIVTATQVYDSVGSAKSEANKYNKIMQGKPSQ